MRKLLSFIILSVIATAAFSQQVKISQVYINGGNAGSTYNRDFTEIFNAGSAPAAIGGWSVQYASAAGNFSSVTAIPAGTTLAPGQYYLCVGASTANGAAFVFDASGSMSMSGTAGKVALVNTNTALGSASCTNAAIVDVFGYGTTASCFETAFAPVTGLDNTKSFYRASNGCTDGNNNSTDFSIAAVTIRNALTTPNPCPTSTPTLIASPASLTNFNAVFGSASSEFSYSVSGSNLSAGPVLITPSAGIQISLSAGGPYTTGQLSISYTAPTLSPTTVYGIIDNTVAAGAFTGSITNIGGGASTTVNITGNILAAEPTVQASNISVSNINDNGFDVNWTNGNGASRIVVVRPTATTNANPTDGSLYTVGSTTGAGNTVQFVGTGIGPITVTGLTLGTNYSVRVYEYNEIAATAGTANYDTAVAVNNPVTTTTTGLGPNLTITNFNAIAAPLYMGSNVVGTNNNARIPVMFYAKVSGLVPSTTYRYYTQGAISGDVGGTTTAGGSVLISYPVASTPTFAYSTSGGFSAGNYATFTTDATGAFTGGFGLVPTGNTRFAGGNMVIPCIVLQKDVTPNGTIRLGLDQTIQVLNFGTPIDSGTFIHGLSAATVGNIVGLWKSTDGSSFTTSVARPLAMTLVEHPTFTGATAWAGSFVTGYDQTATAWNAIIPNNNAAGVQLIQQIDLVTGNTIGCNSAAGGIWPSGANTVSPTGGQAAPIVITSTDAPLTGGACFSILAVSLNTFNATKINSTVKLNWSTAQEINSNHFDVLRSADGVTWTTINTVTAAGNSNGVLNYSVVDNHPVQGRNFYKLRFVDASGRQTYSEIKLVLFTDKLSVIVYPNPVSDRINITLGSNGNSAAEITLINATGNVIGTYKTTSANYSINAAGLAKGIYILKVKADGFNTTQKIIIN